MLNIISVLISVAAITASKNTLQTHQHEDDPVSTLARQAQSERIQVENDQFSPISTHSEMIGKSFKLSISGELRESNSFLDYYSNGILHMSLTKRSYFDRFEMDHSTHATIPKRSTAIEISYKVTSRSNYTAQNSYGAKADISSSVNEVSYIAAVEMPRGDKFKYSSTTSDDPELDQYEWRKTIEGPEAKIIYHGSKLILEGKIGTFTDGKVARCEDSSVTATVSDPIELLNHNCYIAAKIERIAFISGDGSILREWTTSTDVSHNHGLDNPSHQTELAAP